MKKSKRTNVKDINQDKIKAALADEPELLNFWNDLCAKREDDDFLSILHNDKISPESIKEIVNLIKDIEEEERVRHESSTPLN
ncbi:hypothetical protein MWH25_01175 [Natroniella acetigena]|uniref:hypothetical protein n=1 Tax=Natroniella acetigena TaxID=52004 RepID=UPI00200B24DF|nr:hypothetical protein [Natroniella acetigena]MCK8826358.1 hypothetical protein [Natroniella acetigena]